MQTRYKHIHLGHRSANGFRTTRRGRLSIPAYLKPDWPPAPPVLVALAALPYLYFAACRPHGLEQLSASLGLLYRFSKS